MTLCRRIAAAALALIGGLPSAAQASGRPSRLAVLHDFPCSLAGTLGCATAAIHAGLYSTPMLPGFIGADISLTPNVGGARFTDPYTPPSGTFTVSGAMTATGSVTANGLVSTNGSHGASLTYAGSSEARYQAFGAGDWFSFLPSRADASGNVAFLINNQASLTATSKALLLVQNNGTDEWLVNPLGLFSTYNGVVTAGKGMASIRASGAVTGSSAASTTVASYTVPAASTLVRLSGWVDCTAFTSGTVGMTVTYTDPNNVAHTTIAMQGISATSPSGTVSTLGGTGSLTLVTLDMWIKASTTITMQSAISTTATGDFIGIIEQLQ